MSNAYFTISTEAGTSPKSRLTVGELRTILNEVSKSFSETEVSFDVADALNHLEGMIHHSKDGSIVGRHEIYVRHIFDFMIGPQLLKDCIVAFLKYFTRFGQPVITNLGRQKGNLFKFLLNSDFLFSAFQKKKTLVMAERVYGGRPQGLSNTLRAEPSFDMMLV